MHSKELSEWTLNLEDFDCVIPLKTEFSYCLTEPVMMVKESVFHSVIFLKGNSGLRTSWAQMKEHEKCKRTSHH